MTYDADVDLAELGHKGTARVLFYPSCGTRLSGLFDLDYDIFVLSDYYPRNEEARDQFWREIVGNVPEARLQRSTVRSRVFRIGPKRGFLFFQDNNEVLQRIQASGNKISCFVGVNDGCREGGNYECVNDKPFLTRVLAMMPEQGMTYYTDHSSVVEWMPEPVETMLSMVEALWGRGASIRRPEVIWLGNYFRRISISSDFCLKPSYSSAVHQFRVTAHQATIHEWTANRVRLTIEYDNISDHLGELNGAFVSRNCMNRCYSMNPQGWDAVHLEIAPHYYFKPSAKPGWTSTKSMELLLDTCERMKWRVVGTTAFGEGRHEEVLDLLRSWRGTYPNWIRIFHLDHLDFAGIKDRLRRIQ